MSDGGAQELALEKGGMSWRQTCGSPIVSFTSSLHATCSVFTVAVQELTQENLRTFKTVVTVKTKQCESYYLTEINCPDDKDLETAKFQEGMDGHRATQGSRREMQEQQFGTLL